VWDPRQLLTSLRPHRRLTAPDLLAITQQLSALLKAGLTIDRALATTLTLTSRPYARGALERVLHQIREGSTFAEALERESGVPELYLSMIRSGEVSGALPDVMLRLEELLQRTQQVKSRIQSALIYPAILLLMIAVTFTVVVFVVLPRFESLFAEAGTQLPLPTRLVLALGHGMSHFGLYLLAACICVGVALFNALQRPQVRLAIHRHFLTGRWTLGLVGKLETARFLRTLATLLANGVSLPSGIRVARGTMHNQALRAAADELHRRLREGESLAERLSQAKLFPQIAIQLARVGEETGRLEPMLYEAADILDRDAQRTLERLLVLLVPLVTIVMGLLVAGLVASVLVGILSLNDLAL
jgi:general secretion pathway protein F